MVASMAAYMAMNNRIRIILPVCDVYLLHVVTYCRPVVIYFPIFAVMLSWRRRYIVVPSSSLHLPPSLNTQTVQGNFHCSFYLLPLAMGNGMICRSTLCCMPVRYVGLIDGRYEQRYVSVGICGHGGRAPRHPSRRAGTGATNGIAHHLPTASAEE